jgi:hypothetical protein
MYSVATLSFGQAVRLSFLEPIGRFMLWVAVAVWAAVAAAFLVRLVRRPHLPAPGPGRAASGMPASGT